jgi:tetratricopeptide (TPR) repeat protein
MAPPRDLGLLRVFLASPGDVGEERAFVRELLDSILPSDPLLARYRRVHFELVSWDHPHGGPPMLGNMTPQQAILRFKHRPADCDLVIVILYTRIGTHLTMDGTAFQSGTEWEFQDALHARPQPDILVYRRTDLPDMRLNDPDGAEKLRQYGLVQDFFTRFRNPDGTWNGMPNDYAGVDDFRTKLTLHLRHLLAEKLSPADPGPDPVSPVPAASVAPPVRCYGRDSEAATLIAALTTPDPACLLVLGQAGIGKTTLTRRVAADPAVAARFGSRRHFVPLDAILDPAALPAAIVQGLGLNPAATTLPQALASLGGEPALLVLDNLETPWEAGAAATQDTLLTLTATSGVSLLASLRGTASPAAPHWAGRVRLAPLPDEAARHLFLDLAPEAAADPAMLDRFLTALAGVPLAVELVALRAAGDTPLPELWAEWERRGVALAEHPDEAAGRLTSLGRSLDLSWQSRRLRDPGRRLFRLLGALPAGMADEDRRALLDDDATEAARQLRTVGLAVQQGDRLDLLPPVRRWAQSDHPPEADEPPLWHRHYLTLARDTGGQILRAEGAAALTRLAPEVANIEAALLAAPAAGLLTEAVAALDGVDRLLSATGAGSLAPYAALAAACDAAGNPRGQAACHFWHGLTAFDRSDHAAARAAYEQALPLYRQVGDVQGEANCIHSLGDIALHRSDHAAARAAYEQALPLFRQVGAVQGEANCIQSLGDIALARSDHAAARAAYEQALPLYRQVGDVLGEAACILSLGNIALRRSDHAAARAAYQQALPLFRQVGAVQGEANCIQSLGDIALDRSDHAAARAAYEQALPLYRQVGDVLGEANCIWRLGDIALARSDHAAARAAYEQALPLYRQVGDVLGEANCIQSLGDIALRRSDHAAARAAYEQALPLYRQVGAVLGEAICHAMLGRVALAEGDRGTARTRFQTALTAYESIGARQNVAIAHADLAGVTDGAERDAHVAAAKQIWLAMDLPEEAARLDARFGWPRGTGGDATLRGSVALW